MILSSITLIRSHPRTVQRSVNVIGYGGPANYSAINLDFRNHSSTQADTRATLTFRKDALCQPDDDLNQYLWYDNITMSLENNPSPNMNLHNIVIFAEETPHRKIIASIANLNLVNIENNAAPALAIFGNPTVELYLSNITVSNYYSGTYAIFLIIMLEKIHAQNLMFDRGNELSYPLLDLLYVFQSVSLESTTISNWIAPELTVSRLISLNNIESTLTLIENVTVSNSSIYRTNVVGNISPLQQLTIKD